ncbi:hypothetical protein ScPMuIL_016094 [Solemya velum]
MADYRAIKRDYTISEPRRGHSGASTRPWLRRHYGTFSNVMTRHASRFREEKDFVENMFKIFDVDGDEEIDRPRTIEAVGEDQYETYKKSVITDMTQSIHKPIKKNALPLFRSPSPKTKSKKAGQVSMLRDDVALFSRLYIVMQHREGDMDTFFKHENHPHPPSLSDSGKLRQGKKSDLVGILVQQTHDSQVDPPSFFDAKILDGAAVVHLLPVTKATTFDD